ncbi:hypothetical protein [Microbispora sp. CA-102843]|uniref:hypothetical protein n=1 Tax=Microbispora sp. CA-102843 TaxID=3239952 RepID=UPI003D91BD62
MERLRPQHRRHRAAEPRHLRPRYRPIAAGLQIPEETVRRWLRQARRSVDRIRRRAADALFHADPDMFARLAPLRSALADALNMLFAAAVATARRHRLESVCLWCIAAMICGGHLLADARPDGSLSTDTRGTSSRTRTTE